MRTISENVHCSLETSIMDKIGFYPKNKYAENKSCFYELGARKTVVFGTYSNKPVSKLVQTNRRERSKHQNILF